MGMLVGFDHNLFFRTRRLFLLSTGTHETDRDDEQDKMANMQSISHGVSILKKLYPNGVKYTNVFGFASLYEVFQFREFVCCLMEDRIGFAKGKSCHL
jgi:hypothetical protein